MDTKAVSKMNDLYILYFLPRERALPFFELIYGDKLFQYNSLYCNRAQSYSLDAAETMQTARSTRAEGNVNAVRYRRAHRFSGYRLILL
jgi:hypothetical protein